METKSAGSSSSLGDGKRVLTVGYIVTQTVRMIAQLIVQARIQQSKEESEYTTGQWLNIKCTHSRLLDEDLQRVITRQGDTPQGLVLDILAHFTSADTQILLERWTIQFTEGSHSEPNIPSTINDKVSIVLVRSICSFLRLLPAHSLARRCKKQAMPFTIRYSLSTPPPVNSIPVPSATSPFSSPSIQGAEGQRRRGSSTYSFGSIVSESGTLSTSVEYKIDLAMFKGSFTIDPFVISDYTPTVSVPINIVPSVNTTITTQSAPTRMGFYGSPRPPKMDEEDNPEKEEFHFIPAKKNPVQHPTIHVPQPKKPLQDFFHMSPSPPSPLFDLAQISSSAPPEARPASPFIVSTDTTLSSSPSEDLMVPEISSFYVKDQYGRHRLSISPSSSPPPSRPALEFPKHKTTKRDEDIFFSAQLPPDNEDEILQFGAFADDGGSESELDKFMRMCSRPPELKMFTDKKHSKEWTEDLKEFRQFLSGFSS